MAQRLTPAQQRQLRLRGSVNPWSLGTPHNPNLLLAPGGFRPPAPARPAPAPAPSRWQQPQGGPHLKVHPNSPAALMANAARNLAMPSAPRAALTAPTFSGKVRPPLPVLPWTGGPQGGDESDLLHATRSFLGAVTPNDIGQFRQLDRWAAGVGQSVRSDIAQTARNAMDTPNARAARAQQQQVNPAASFAGWQLTPGQGPGADRGGGRKHNGWDLSGQPVGTPVPAPFAGKVVSYKPNNGNAGNMMTVQYDNGKTHTFMHLSGAAVQPGQTFSAGQPIALAGNSGNASTRGTDRAVLHVEGSAGINPFAGMPAVSMPTQPNAPAFDKSGYQAQMKANTEAAKLLSTPYSSPGFEKPVLPDRPTPIEFQAPDFSAGNEAFAASAPTNPFDDPKEARKMVRQQYFRGIGQALAGLQGGEHFGTVLARMGGGALMGRAKGEEMVQAREDEFAKEMQAYQRALAARNDGQAQIHAEVANQNIQVRNRDIEARWMDQLKEIEKWGTPGVEGDNFTFYEPDPSDPNKIRKTFVPMGFAAQASAIAANGAVAASMGAANNQHAMTLYGDAMTTFRWQTSQAWRQNERAEDRQMYAQMQGGGGTQGPALVTELGLSARSVVEDGSWMNLYNDKSRPQSVLAGITAEVAPDIRMVGGKPSRPLTKDEQTMINDRLVTGLVEEAIRNNKMHVLINYPNTGGRPQNTTVMSSRIASDAEAKRTTQRTDWRGRTTTTESTNYR